MAFSVISLARCHFGPLPLRPVPTSARFCSPGIGFSSICLAHSTSDDTPVQLTNVNGIFCAGRLSNSRSVGSFPSDGTPSKNKYTALRPRRERPAAQEGSEGCECGATARSKHSYLWSFYSSPFMRSCMQSVRRARQQELVQRSDARPLRPLLRALQDRADVRRQRCHPVRRAAQPNTPVPTGLVRPHLGLFPLRQVPTRQVCPHLVPSPLQSVPT